MSCFSTSSWNRDNPGTWSCLCFLVVCFGGTVQDGDFVLLMSCSGVCKQLFLSFRETKWPQLEEERRGLGFRRHCLDVFGVCFWFVTAGEWAWTLDMFLIGVRSPRDPWEPRSRVFTSPNQRLIQNEKVVICTNILVILMSGVFRVFFLINWEKNMVCRVCFFKKRTLKSLKSVIFDMRSFSEDGRCSPGVVWYMSAGCLTRLWSRAELAVIFCSLPETRYRLRCEGGWKSRSVLIIKRAFVGLKSNLVTWFKQTRHGTSRHTYTQAGRGHRADAVCALSLKAYSSLPWCTCFGVLRGAARCPSEHRFGEQLSEPRRRLFKSGAPPRQLLCQGLNLLLLLFSAINRGLCDARPRRVLCNQMAVSRSPCETPLAVYRFILQYFFPLQS